MPWVEGKTIVVELRLTCNLSDHTIDKVIAKMKRSHTELIDMMLDDFGRVEAPSRALLPLRGLLAEAQEAKRMHDQAQQLKRAQEARAGAKCKTAIQVNVNVNVRKIDFANYFSAFCVHY